MSDEFWANVLEPGENLLWTGRPQPRLSLRNFQLLGPFIGAAGTVIAGGLLLTFNDLPVSQSVVMGIVIALVVLSLVKGFNRWNDLRRTRYALTNHRALFFKQHKGQTKVKAFSRAAETKPDIRQTSPPSVFFIRQEREGSPGLAAHLGFEYVAESDRLCAVMENQYKGAET